MIDSKQGGEATTLRDAMKQCTGADGLLRLHVIAPGDVVPEDAETVGPAKVIDGALCVRFAPAPK